jgi:hypothetical protein
MKRHRRAAGKRYHFLGMHRNGIRRPSVQHDDMARGMAATGQIGALYRGSSLRKTGVAPA